jgi:hypothetical protein
VLTSADDLTPLARVFMKSWCRRAEGVLAGLSSGGGGPPGDSSSSSSSSCSSIDTSGRVANKVAAPMLDRELATRSLGACTFKGAPLPPGLVAPMRESWVADGTAELYARLQQDGYVLLRGVLDLESVRSARVEVFRRLAEVGEVKDEPGTPCAAGVVTGTSRRRELYPDPASLSEFWRSVSEGPQLRRCTHGAAVADAISVVLGEEAVGHNFTYLRCVSPGQGKQTDLHFDHSFFATRLDRPETMLTCWTAFTPTTPVDGGLFVVEKSTRFEDCISMIRGVEAVKTADFPSAEPPWIQDEAYLAQLKALGRVAPSRTT